MNKKRLWQYHDPSQQLPEKYRNGYECRKNQAHLLLEKKNRSTQPSSRWPSGNNLKVLGVYFSNDLPWDFYIDKGVNKARSTLLKLKFLTKFLNKPSMKKTVTSHFYGMVYCRSNDRPNKLTTSTQWRKLNSIHYRALRICLKDFRNTILRRDVNTKMFRATPSQWMRYSNHKQAIKLYLLGDKSSTFGIKMRSHVYINNR